MKLHLHLGAHKTATTHFQNVMLCNRDLYEEQTHYVPMDEFRENITHDSRLLNPRCNEEVDGYLEQLKRTEKQNLIISEENILGDAKDIYRSTQLYCKMQERSSRLSDFVSRFSDATIWISIRSMDAFIPSLYCESLLHWRFRRFSQVFSGQYEQSWIPVVLVLRDSFPNAKINVIPYETYGAVLPKWLEVMTGIKVGWNLQENERPRVSLNSLALRVMNVAHLFIPPSKGPGVLQAMSRHFAEKGMGGNYSPFNESVASDLKSLYTKDLEKIESLSGNIHLFKG